jgi:hypothetical protein
MTAISPIPELRLLAISSPNDCKRPSGGSGFVICILDTQKRGSLIPRRGRFQASPVALLPFARKVLELSSHSGTPAALKDALIGLAMDAMQQVEGGTSPQQA